MFLEAPPIFMQCEESLFAGRKPGRHLRAGERNNSQPVCNISELWCLFGSTGKNTPEPQSLSNRLWWNLKYRKCADRSFIHGCSFFQMFIDDGFDFPGVGLLGRSCRPEPFRLFAWFHVPEAAVFLVRSRMGRPESEIHKRKM